MKSVYYESLLESKKTVHENDEDSQDVTIVIGRKYPSFNQFDWKNNILLSKEEVFQEEFNVSESIPEMSWELTEETKKNNDVVLTKVTTTFRGREYIAWVSLNYPIPIGPWKFNNLPGLAYDICDREKKYRWILKGIEKTPNTSEYYLKQIENKLDTISIKEFLSKKDNQGDSFLKTLATRLPEGTTLDTSSSKINIKRKYGRELIYEWEKEEENEEELKEED